MFWFKRKEIVVDLFTPFQSVADEYPIELTRKFTPKWFKGAKPSYLVDDFKPHPTLKGCTGMLDLWQKGFIIPLWTDCVVKVNKVNQEVGAGDFEWQTADSRTTPISHHHNQWSMFADPKKHGHFKFGDCWAMKTKEDIKWHWSAPYWHQGLDLDYTTPPAIINGYDTSMTLNVQLMLKVDKPKVIEFTAGDPMVQMIPLSDRNIKIKTHVVDHQEFINLTSEASGIGVSKFINGYKSSVKNTKKRKESKCPFHFK
jgi:hypothetical protein